MNADRRQHSDKRISTARRSEQQTGLPHRSGLRERLLSSNYEQGNSLLSPQNKNSPQLNGGNFGDVVRTLDLTIPGQFAEAKLLLAGGSITLLKQDGTNEIDGDSTIESIENVNQIDGDSTILSINSNNTAILGLDRADSIECINSNDATVLGLCNNEVIEVT